MGREGRVRTGGELREMMGWAEKGFVSFIRPFTFILRENVKNCWKCGEKVM